MRNDELKTPYELFGWEIGEGWFKIVEPVVKSIEEYNSQSKGGNIEIAQIKEKWGGLEIYLHFDGVPSDVVKKFNDMVAAAREEASHTCEDCGTKKNVGMIINKWYRTVCQECAEKQVKRMSEHLSPEFAARKWKRLVDGKVFKSTENGSREIEQ